MRLLPLLLLLFAGCAAGERATDSPGPVPPGEEGAFLAAGYHPWWLRENWSSHDFETLDALYFFEVEVGGDGAIRSRNGWPDRWLPMRREVQRRGAQVIPTVTLFDQQAFVTLFSNPDSARALRTTLVDLVRDSPGIGGLQLDFEIFQRVDPAVRNGFTAFVADLRQALRGVNPALSLSLYALAYDDSDVYDEAALARSVDYFVVQGYDLHDRNGDVAGPVAASAGWGRKNVRYVVERFLGLGVPRRKIVLAVPYFGYEWPTQTDAPGSRTRGRGETITYAEVDARYLPGTRRNARVEAARHGLRRDPASGSPYYVYQDSTGWRQGWFEDPESLRAKYDYVRAEGLRGVAVFPLGYGDETLAQTLRAAFGE